MDKSQAISFVKSSFTAFGVVNKKITFVSNIFLMLFLLHPLEPFINSVNY